MRHARLLPAILLLAPLCGACRDSHNGTPPTAFDPLVTDLIQNQTTDTGEPVEVNGQTFSFPTEDTAFDDVLPADTGAVVDQ
jgi:hypothetical protein